MGFANDHLRDEERYHERRGTALVTYQTLENDGRIFHASFRQNSACFITLRRS